MPRIQTYESQVSAQGQVGGRRADASDFGADQFSSIGQALGGVADFLRQRQEDDELSDAQAQVAKSRADLTQWYMARAQQTQPGDKTFAQSTRDGVDQHFETLGERYHSKKAQQYVKLHGTTIAGDFFAKGLEHESVLAGAKAKQDFTEIRDAYGRVVAADPAQYSTLIDEIDNLLDTGAGQYGNISVTTRNELKAQTKEYLAWSASAKLAEENPEGFLRSVAPETVKYGKSDPGEEGEGEVLVTANRETEMPFFNDLPAEKQLALVEKANAQFKQDMAVERADLVALRKDQAVEVRSTGAVQAPLSKNNFVRAYGDRWEPEWKAYQRDVRVGSLVHTGRNMSATEQAAMVARYEPAPGAGYAEAKLDQIELDQSFAAAREARRKDPIGYAMQTGFMAVDEVAPGADPAEITTNLESRAEMARTVAETYGTPLTLLTAQEVVGQREALRVMTPSQLTDYFGNLRNSKLEQNAFNSVVRQVAEDSPSVRIAAQLMGVDSQYTTTSAFSNAKIYHPSDIAQRIFEGRFALDTAPGANKEDGAGSVKATSLPKNKDMAAVFNDYVGAGFGARYKDKDDVYEAVVAHYVGETLRRGVDPGAEFNDSAFKHSIELVLGGQPATLGGKKVLVPWGMPEGEFRERLESRFNKFKATAERAGQKIAGDYDDYAWVPVRDGVYVPVSGSTPLDISVDVIGNSPQEASGKVRSADKSVLIGAIKAVESGGQRFGAGGGLLTSPKGAQGEMQVMPYTARDPGYGVLPAQNNSPEELARVGEDYIMAMESRYGDLKKAAAAYNMGPTALDNALAESAKTGKDWMTLIPEETREYVPKVMAKMGKS